MDYRGTPHRQNSNYSTHSAQWNPNQSSDFNDNQPAASTAQLKPNYGDTGYRERYDQQIYGNSSGAYDSAAAEPPVRRAATLPRSQNPASKYGAGRASFAPPKSTGDLRMWRHDERGNMWTKGSRGRCFGRFCCCTIMMTVFFIISILLALLLWVRPPDIAFNGIQLPTGGNAVNVQADGLHINLELGITVKNPNFFAASFTSINAKAFYPPLVPSIGGGTLNDITFPSNSVTTFTFPFNITYVTDVDPTRILTTDLVNRCGIKAGSTKRDLTVRYQLGLGIRFLFVTISPTFSGDASFECPVTRADLQQLGGDALLQALGVE